MENYKEKYEDALERARVWKEKSGMPVDKQGILDDIFPELKESDDEKIRKTLKSFFDSEISDYGNVEWRNGIRYGEIVSWLEKQGKKIDVIENFDTEFEKQVSHFIASAINKEHEYNQGYVKWTANALLNYAKHEFEKKDGSSYPYQPGWRKNYSGNKPKVKHSVLMLTTHGIAEGEWLGEEWCQYRWSCKVKDTEVLYWMHLSDLENLEKENEKQGEQKPADKVEPKFKIDTWIYHEISGNTFHINKIENDLYVSDEGATISLGRQNDWRLWTIQDAKDGDIIANGDMVLIFKCLEEPSYRQHIIAHIGLDINGNIQVTNESWNLGLDWAKPATKEQRDLLFQKMKEAGYEWDVEKKELKKIEQNPTEWKGEDYGIYKSIIDDAVDRDLALTATQKEWIRNLKPQPKQEWSEGDDYILNLVSKFTSKGYKSHPKIPSLEFVQDWLKSLKVRIQHQHKQEWSEEDWKYYHKLEMFLEVNEHYSKTEKSSGYQKDVHETLSWLKSLRPNKYVTWSEEDEKMFNSIIEVLEVTPSARFVPIKREIMIPWLESLKERMKGE